MFIELIQIALGTRTVLSRIPSENEWQQIYDSAAKQSLVGVVLSGIEVIRAKNVELSVPKMLLLQLHNGNTLERGTVVIPVSYRGCNVPGYNIA